MEHSEAHDPPVPSAGRSPYRPEGASNHVQFPVAIEEGEDGYLIAEVIGLPGCRTQARSHDALLQRIREAISLYVAEHGTPEPHRFVGLEQVDVEV